jgi:hypothetical protein
MNPNRNKVIAVLLATGVLSLAPVAHGAFIASYDFADNSNSTVGELNSSALAFAYAGTDTGRSSDQNAFVRSNATGSTQADALADTSYLSFTVNAASGYQLNLSSLKFDFGGSSATGSTLESNIVVQSSVGGVGTGNPILHEEKKNVTGTPTSFDTGNVITLSASQFQALSSVTFQFRFYDNFDDISHVNRLDNVVLEGTVSAVPEPAALAMVSLGAGALLTRRRAKWICAV